MPLSWLSALWQYLLPSMCLWCHCTLAQSGCCEACQQQLPWLNTACPRCAYPMALPGLCGQCLHAPPAFQATIIPFVYASPINGWIQALKFHEQFAVVPFLAHSLWCKLISHYQDQAWPQVMLPVPLHAKRLRQRGYNQALLLANYVAQRSGIACVKTAVIKTRVTPAQAGLKKRARRVNVKHAFELAQPLAYQHVALVDDVFTTGATVQEIACLLQQQGIKRVDVWCVARTV